MNGRKIGEAQDTGTRCSCQQPEDRVNFAGKNHEEEYICKENAAKTLSWVLMSESTSISMSEASAHGRV